jgi:hypothetical protein
MLSPPSTTVSSVSKFLPNTKNPLTLLKLAGQYVSKAKNPQTFYFGHFADGLTAYKTCFSSRLQERK